MFCDICNSLADGLTQSVHAAALSAALLANPAPQDGANDAGAYVIANVTVIDVEVGAALPGRWVRIEDGVIANIKGAASPELMADATVIDAEGKYLIPGLFDAHVHFSPTPETYGPLLVAHGVTCVRDLGAMTEAIIALRDASRTSDVVAPEIICAGAIIDGDPPVWPFSEPCDTEEEARAAVNKLHKAGVDQIKVYSKLKAEVYRAAVDEAHKLGLKAVGHVPDEVSFDQVIAARQDSLEHMMGVDKLLLDITNDAITDEDKQHPWHAFRGFLNYDKADKTKLRAGLQRLKDANIAVCPTVAVLAGIARVGADDAESDANLQYVPAHMRAFWSNPAYAEFAAANRAVLPSFIKLVGELHKAGVTLMVGTDLANAYVFAGSSVHDEMAFFAQAGIPPADILRAATIVPAKFCGVDDRLGSIALGKAASLALLGANPLENIDYVRRIEGVFLRGRYFDRAALDAELEAVRKNVEGSMPASKSDELALELPGRVLLRGRYTMRFQQFDAGVEDFLITETDDGYHIQSHIQPSGGPQPPNMVTLHTDRAGMVQSAELKVLANSATTATYALTSHAIDVTANVSGEEKQQHVDLPAGSIIVSPAAAGDFSVNRQYHLGDGETQGFTSYGFGYPSWEVAPTPVTMKRLADETLTMPGGQEVTVEVVESSMKTDFGPVVATSWIHPCGLTVRSVLKMPFGEIEIKLASLDESSGLTRTRGEGAAE